MEPTVYRLFVERKEGFRSEAERIFSEMKEFLKIEHLTGVRFLNRYDVQGLSETDFRRAAFQIFADPRTDLVFFPEFPQETGETALAVEYLPGQYDQRADSASQCAALLCGADGVTVRTARVYVFRGALSAAELDKIRAYLINPVDSREAAAEKPSSLVMEARRPDDIPEIAGFTALDGAGLEEFLKQRMLAMDSADLRFLQEYFRQKKRNPTETELRVLDTYWSDHCRHTTFGTALEKITVPEGPAKRVLERALRTAQEVRTELGIPPQRPVSLMELACSGAKVLKKRGLADDVETSAEINACSVFIPVSILDDAGKQTGTEEWLLMFKNETHNHPTEIEPFGGAATCIGGAIRDPLSGRAWVYQSMRVTGAADPTVPVSAAIPGKLPQSKLTREAAAGFSAYGNQIGLTTGQVTEYYHPGFAAKRMELGAVLAAAPVSAVRREEPEAGDVVILVGGGTGRDGIGGATGSSKAHTEKSVETAGAEVQKGNAVEERKLQRLFRNRRAAAMIRRCNDFGAGGVAVAVGELAPGLDIDLDAVPKKYDGLDGTELAISESQERMAVVVREADAAEFLRLAAAENLNGTVIARVTGNRRLVMRWRGRTIVDLDRDFLDTAGAKHSAQAILPQPAAEWRYPGRPAAADPAKRQSGKTDAQILQEDWLAVMTDFAVAGQRGLAERFDGSIGAASVLFPFGGREQATPEAGIAARIPVDPGKETSTVSLMTHGFDPLAMEWSPFHGAQFAVLHSLAKILALGGDPFSARLSFQEYFERMGSPESWGKPAAALLGALEAQLAAGTPAIGGKDSMSGSFGSLHVPPSLVSFAVAVCQDKDVRSGAFRRGGSRLFLLYTPWDADNLPDWNAFRANASLLQNLAAGGGLLSACPVGPGGIGAALLKAAFGNRMGLTLDTEFLNRVPLPPVFREAQAGAASCGLTRMEAILFAPLYGSLILETDGAFPGGGPGGQQNLIPLGVTVDGEQEPAVRLGECRFPLAEARERWESVFDGVFPRVSGKQPEPVPDWACRLFRKGAEKQTATARHFSAAKPLAVLPVFPGTNCEYDMERAFRLAGAKTLPVIIRNNSRAALEESLEELRSAICRAQILAFSGGFSAGDEPDGSAKFIASVLREERIAESVTDLFSRRDGLILGICNGFQALVKTGLVPFGKILSPSGGSGAENADGNLSIEMCPTLTFNTVGRHISRFVTTKIVSDRSPWTGSGPGRDTLPGLEPGSIHRIPVSHGEGRLIVEETLARSLFADGQIFSQYVDETGAPAAAEPDNPNGSRFAVEGMTDATGRILGKMGHSERAVDHGPETDGSLLFKNIPGALRENIFTAGVRYFC